MIADVGAAGLWRLLEHVDMLRGFDVVIVVALRTPSGISGDMLISGLSRLAGVEVVGIDSEGETVTPTALAFLQGVPNGAIFALGNQRYEC